ncbi:MAG: hypothetical protein ACJAU0_002087 [Flavobacteriales bacterium]|jgi:hypothetical protein
MFEEDELFFFQLPESELLAFFSRPSVALFDFIITCVVVLENFETSIKIVERE